MAQHDFNIDNADGATFRADLNAALHAIQTRQSGAGEPPALDEYMFWADETLNLYRVRNAANSEWTARDTLDSARTPSHVANVTLELRDLFKTHLVDASGGPVTLTLPDITQTLNPAGTLSGAYIAVVKVDASANAVTVSTGGNGNINGQPNRVLATAWDSITPVTDGANWFLISSATDRIASPGMTQRVETNFVNGEGRLRFYVANEEQARWQQRALLFSIGVARPSIETLTISADWTPDLIRQDFEATLAATATVLNPSNPVAGVCHLMRFEQDGTGGHALSWGTDYIFADSSPPVITSGAGAVDFIQFRVRSDLKLEEVGRRQNIGG